MRTKQVLKKLGLIIAGSASVLGVVYSLSLFSPVDTARAGASHNVFGFAWSEIGGWISFNSSNCDTDSNGFVDSGNYCGGDNLTTLVHDYGVNVDASGNFSGHAWSTIVGWISFEDTDVVAMCGSPTATLNMSTHEVSGWARVVSGGGSSNGCIEFKTVAHGGVTASTTVSEFEGYAWAPDVLGWISFNCADRNMCGTSNYAVTFVPPVPPPTLTFFADATIEYGTGAPLSWSTTNVVSDGCTASGAWSGNKDSSGNDTTGLLTSVGTYVYTLTCVNSIGISTSSDVTIVVKDPQCSDGSDNDDADVWFDDGDPGLGENIASADPSCYDYASTSPAFNPSNPSAWYIGTRNESTNPQCSDGIDNDGDGKVDTADGGCHTDFDPSDPLTYNKFRNREQTCNIATSESTPSCDLDEETFGSCPVDCAEQYRLIEF